MSKIHQSTWNIDKLRSCIIPAEWNLKFLSVRAQSGNCFRPITAILWMFFSENLIYVRIQFGTFGKFSMCIMHWNVWQIGKLMCYAVLAGPNMNILLIRALSCNLCWLTNNPIVYFFPEKNNNNKKKNRYNIYMVLLLKFHWAECIGIHHQQQLWHLPMRLWLGTAI